MHSEGFGLKPSDRSLPADVFVREEPDEDEGGTAMKTTAKKAITGRSTALL
jgi:hypothetical protein